MMPSKHFTLTVLAAFVLGLFSFRLAFGADNSGVRWETNYDSAAYKAKLTNKTLFVHIVGNAASAQSDPSQTMDAEVFAQQNIAVVLNTDYVPVRINVNEQPAFAAKFNITALPTDLVIKPDGQLVHRRQGNIPAAKFADYLMFLKDKITVPQQNEAAVEKPQVAVYDPFQTAQPPQESPVRHPVLLELNPQPVHPAPIASNQIVPYPQQPGHPAPVASNQIVPYPQQPVHPAPIAPNQIVSYPQPAHPADTNAAGNTESNSNRYIVEVPLALEGFCPVTLCTEERWVAGVPSFCTMYQGKIFRFASQEALIAFAKAPERYVPAAMGEDIVLLIDRNRRALGERKYGAWFQNRVFLFASQETLESFAARPEHYAEIAVKYDVVQRNLRTPVLY